MGVQMCGGELMIDDDGDVERNLLFATLLMDPIHTAGLQREYLGCSLEEAAAEGLFRDDEWAAVDEVELLRRVHKQQEVTPDAYIIPMATDRVPGSDLPVLRVLYPGLTDTHGVPYMA